MGSSKMTSEELASLEVYVQSLDTSGRLEGVATSSMILPNEVTTYQQSLRRNI